MGLLTALFTGAPIASSGPATPGPTDDFWYTTPGGVSLSGVVVSPETALKLSAYYRGVDLIARATAAVPWIITRDLPDDRGEERAKEHRWYRKLHRRPNLWQTSAEFRYHGMWRVLNRGNFYARIDVVRGDEVLEPLETERMTVKLVDGPRGRRRGYLYRPERGNPEPYTQDEIFHVMGPPRVDGAAGVSVIERARVALGRSLAQQEWAARFFSQNGTPPFAMSHPGKLGDVAYKRLQESVQSRAAGLANAHKAFILEEGMKIEKLGLTLRDSQFIELDQFGVVDVCRWLGMPPHKVYELSRATFSNIEHQAIEFLTDTMDPWFVFWEQAAERDLLGDDDEHHVKLVREGLLRGDLLSRAQAYASFIDTGVMAPNEARAREGLPKFPGLDEPKRAENRSGGDRSGDPMPRPGGGGRDGRPIRTPQPPDDGDDDANARIARASIRHLVTVETSNLRRLAERHADAATFRERAADFYGKYAETVARALDLDVPTARQYTTEHFEALMTAVDRELLLDNWETDAPAALAALALGR